MRRAEGAPGAPSLRRLLLRLVAFTQVPGLLAAAAFLVVYHDAERARTREALMTSTLTLAGALQARLARVERELDVLAAQVPASPDDLFGFYQRALYARDAAGADGIVLVDAQARVLLDTRVPLQPGLQRPVAPELAKPLRSGKPELHDLSLLPGAGVATAGIGIPVVRGARLYALQAELAPRRFQELLEQQHLPRDWLAAVADARGALVARMPNPELARGQPLPEELRRQMADRDNGIVEMRSLQGVPVATAFRRSPATGWITFVSVPQSRLYASVLRSAAWLALLLALAFGATAWLALRLRARIVTGVDELRLAAGALAGGHPVARAGAPFAEFAVVQDALRASSEEIRAAHGELAEGEQRLATIFHTAQEAIVVSDARHHQVVLMNDAAVRLFGPHARAGSSVRQLFTVASWADYLEHLAAAGPGGSRAHPWKGEGQQADGGTVPLEYSVSTFVDAHGARFATLIARDIGERVRSEAALAAAQQEIRRLDERFQLALLHEADTRQAAIARELHDAVGSSLAAASLLLGTAHALAGSTVASGLIDKAQAQVKEVAERVRQISRGIMPAGSEGGALQQALEHFAQDVSAIAGVRCSVARRGDFGDVPAQVGGHLYRIVQEATHNALRHGQATRIRITLARAGPACRLTVRDNGRGADFGGVARTSPGLGLRSMQARAAAIGGQLALTTAPGGGARVQVCWRSNGTTDGAA
jgi:PAS domain S-box-containing protein